MTDPWPKRIVCLTEETVETLYLLGQSHRIAAVTGYAVRPPAVRREKPRVGAFTSADMDKILAVDPDLVLTFSDLQADIAALCLRAGLPVHGFNQRDVAGCLAMIRTLGALVGASQAAEALATGFETRIAAMQADPPRHRPRVYVEEWDDPMIAGIGWVSELVEIAGGIDVFAPLRAAHAARDRILDSASIIQSAPDIIIASWCGKKVRPEKLAARPGWGDIPAVARNEIHEIKSPLLLAPGPAALGDGLDALRAIILGWQERQNR